MKSSFNASHIHCIIVKCMLILLCCAEAEEEEGGTDVAGIPDFWLHVLQSHKGWSEEVSSVVGVV